jgi:hypothetical protein
MAISKKTISKTLKAQRSQTPGAFTVDQANPFSLVLTLASGELFDGAQNVYCEFHSAQYPTTDPPLANVVIASPTTGVATFNFTSAQMNQTLPSAERALWMVAFATWADGRIEVLWRANVTMNAHHASMLAASPPVPTLGITMQDADARYRLQGVDIAQSNITGLAASLALLAPRNNAALTGNPTAPTQAALNSSTRLATTAFVMGEKASVLTALYDHSAENDSDFAAIIDALALKAPLAAPTFSGAVVMGTGGPGGGNSLSIGVNTPTTFNGLTTWASSATFAYEDGTVAGFHRTALGFEAIGNYVTLAASQILTNKTLDAPAIKTNLGFFNPANTFAYTITPAAIAANRILNLPLITATDTLATLGLAQTFTAQQTFTNAGGTTFSGSPIIISGNISSAAWTTGGIRIKGTPGTLTDTTSSGTVVAAYTDVMGGNTIAASAATTFTNYVSFYLKEPVAGTNVTLTNKWALGADSARFGTSNQATFSNGGALSLAALLTSTQSIGTTPTDGVLITNTTWATTGAQQYSPALSLSGDGFATVGGRMPVKFRQYVVPVQVTGSAPTGLLTWDSSVGNAAAVTRMTLSTAGLLGVTSLTASSLVQSGTAAPGAASGLSNLTAIGQSWSLIGGDNATDSAIKAFRLGGLHYLSAEEPVTGLYTYSSAAATTLSLGGGTSSGNACTSIQFYTAADNITTTGSSRWTINSSGHFLATTDNTYDIGASGANRPRNLFVSGNGTIGGTLAVSGLFSASTGAVVGAASLTSCALLEVVSTTKGFLLPKHTTTQRDAVASPVAGLAVYNTTTNKLNFYNGSAWEAVTSA